MYTLWLALLFTSADQNDRVNSKYVYLLVGLTILLLPSWGIMLLFLCGILFGSTTGLTSLLTLTSARIEVDIPAWAYRDLPIITGSLLLYSLCLLALILFVRIAYSYFWERQSLDSSQDRSSVSRKMDIPQHYREWSVTRTSTLRRTSDLSRGGGGRMSYGSIGISSVPFSDCPPYLDKEEQPSSTKASETIPEQLHLSKRRSVLVTSNLMPSFQASPLAEQKGRRQAKFSSENPRIISAHLPSLSETETNAIDQNASNDKSQYQRYRDVLWWLFLSNIELLRYDLNRLMAGGSVFRINLIWSLSLKFLVPMLCAILLNHIAADILTTISGNLVIARENVTREVPFSIQLWNVDFFVTLWGCIITAMALCIIMALISYMYPAFLGLLFPIKHCYPILNYSHRTSEPQLIYFDKDNFEHFVFLEFVAAPFAGNMPPEDSDYLQSFTDVGDINDSTFPPSRIYKKITTAVFERMTHQSLADIEAVADQLIQVKGFSTEPSISGPLG